MRQSRSSLTFEPTVRVARTPDEVLTEPNLRKAFGENEMRVGSKVLP